MLYDPRWEVQTELDVFSMEGLIAWLERRPASETYNFCNPWNCMLCQYFRSHGFKKLSVDPKYIYYNGERRQLPPFFNDVAQPSGFGWRFWRGTFGGALARAREAARQ